MAPPLNIAHPETVTMTDPAYGSLLRAREMAFTACTNYHAFRSGPVITAIAPFVTFGPDGEASNIDALVRALRTDRPGWFRQDQVATEQGPWTGPHGESV